MPAETVYDTKVGDVAIIGAGPAGLSAAYYCAKAGLQTHVLEEHPAVGVPVHCGECISQIAVDRMALSLPAEAIAAKVKGIRVVFPNGESCILREEGYVLNKAIFEQSLAVRAQGEGANLSTGARVLGMSRRSKIWSLNARAFELKAKTVIDASGFNSVSNTLIKTNPQKFSIVNGAQYLMQDIPNDGFIEFFIWPRLAPHGYLWVIPKADGTANVGLVSSDAKTVHSNLKLFIKEKGLEKNKILHPFGGVIPSSGPLPRTYADGLLMAGDAAGFTSPMFEGGTQLALKSGELAASTIINIENSIKQKNAQESGEQGAPEFPPEKEEDSYNEKYLSSYEAAWKKEFPPYPRLLKGKNHFYSFSEQDLNKLASILPEDLTDLQFMDKMQIGARLLTKAPGLIAKNFFSAMDTFAYSTGENYGW
ncbi:hypothetical protein COU37_01475 [Candidatus Micrarchaeota archaeon CG10_big_fil_rev_8_21_14_0_10_45_29]|nr:MAG: hypothetical protein COU37_01475 [Candidatus Micrarchaeota archaeon CG10_big_fil_rev_8_21_14_0_10_45_29]